MVLDSSVKFNVGTPYNCWLLLQMANSLSLQLHGYSYRGEAQDADKFLTLHTNLSEEDLAILADRVVSNGVALGVREVTALNKNGRGKDTSIKSKSANHPILSPSVPANASLSKIGMYGAKKDIEAYQCKGDKKIKHDLEALLSILRGALLDDFRDIEGLDRLVTAADATIVVDNKAQELYAFACEDGRYYASVYEGLDNTAHFQVVYKNDYGKFVDSITHKEVSVPEGAAIEKIKEFSYIRDIKIENPQELQAYLESNRDLLLADPHSACDKDKLGKFCKFTTCKVVADADLQYVATRYSREAKRNGLSNSIADLARSTDPSVAHITGRRSELGFSTPFAFALVADLEDATKKRGMIRHADERGQFLVRNAESVEDCKILHIYQDEYGALVCHVTNNEQELLREVNKQRRLGYDTMVNPMVGWCKNAQGEFEINPDRVVPKDFACSLKELSLEMPALDQKADPGSLQEALKKMLDARAEHYNCLMEIGANTEPAREAKKALYKAELEFIKAVPDRCNFRGLVSASANNAYKRACTNAAEAWLATNGERIQELLQGEEVPEDKSYKQHVSDDFTKRVLGSRGAYGANSSKFEEKYVKERSSSGIASCFEYFWILADCIRLSSWMSWIILSSKQLCQVSR